MSWADRAIDLLQAGEEAVIKPKGNSMTPRVRSGETVTLTPVANGNVRKGDVVLVRVKGTVYLHLVHAVEDDRVLIGNNHGKTNGWTTKDNVFGRMVSASSADMAPARYSKAKGRDGTDPRSHSAKAKGGPITRTRL